MSTRYKVLWALGILAVAGGALAYGVPMQYVLIGGLLLLCPLMMMFMHGHGGHDKTGTQRKGSSSHMPVDEPERRSKHE